MTTTMSMRERHKRIEELVMQDPLVCEHANEFNDAQREINEWHVRNSPTAHATMGQLAELDELIAYSEFCLEDLKFAKRCAYNQLMSQYPHVWDTTCPDPFTTDTQTEKEPLAETEEMPTAQSDGDDTPCTCAMCQAEDSEPTDEERAAYLAERDQCDPDDTEREERRDAARRIIADYMGVDPDDVRIICSGVFGPADEPTTPREQDPAAPATVPLAELERIIDEQTSYYEQIRDWANSRGLDASSATVARYIIDKISAQITELANDLIPQEDPNA